MYNSDLSVNEICKVFVKDLITLLNSTIPYQKLSKKQSKMKPWINKILIFECRKKEKLYKNFKKRILKPLKKNTSLRNTKSLKW